MRSFLHVKKLMLAVNIGCTPEEQQVAQKIRVDLKVSYVLNPVGMESDNIKDTLCYDILINKIMDLVKGRSFHLIEHLADTIHSLVMSHDNIESVRTKVIKWPKIPGFTGSTAFEVYTSSHN